MVADGGARKALARALSRVVLSRETILVHAESVLARPDLIRGSLHSAAFELWFAVLQRAEAEEAVERVVGSVLEDNPGAEPLRQALQDWQLAMASPPVEPPPDSLTGPLSSGATARAQRSERARWAVLAVILSGFVALVVAGSLREPELRGPAPVALPSPAVPLTSEVAARAQPGSPVQVGAALQARPPPPLLPVPAESDAGTALEPGEKEGTAGGRVQKRGR